MYRAIFLRKDDDGCSAGLESLSDDQLPDGNVTVAVEFSTLNYKDALAITNSAPVVKSYPMVPGIDFAGKVLKSSHKDFAPEQRVLLNGWGVGENHWGGLCQKTRVNGDWLTPLPKSFTTTQAMAIGTAGYTAMLCVLALEKHGISPRDGEILVTGGTGGVGSIAVSLLSKLGYTVVASTGRLSEAGYLKKLGAHEIIDRALFSEPGRALGKSRWAGAIDVAGSHTLANVLATINYGGLVAACGLAQGLDLPASVAPFILRGITLSGIDSVMVPQAKRQVAWDRLAQDLDVNVLEDITRTIGLGDVLSAAPDLLAGKIRGRVVVDVSS